MRFLDANIFLRFLTRDDEAKAAACRALFDRLEKGEEEGTTSDVVIHEVLYVLCSPRQYGLSHDEASIRMRPLLAVRGLRLPKKRSTLHALDLYATYPFLDFGDALAIVQAGDDEMDAIYSYDTDFDRIPEVHRTEP